MPIAEQKQASILIVEDELASLNLLASYLEAENYMVYKARDGVQAEQILADKVIDVVLLDIRLPGKDGLSLTREIRSQSQVGIILVSQKKDDIDKIVGLEMGADDYITKPYNPRELLVRVKNLLIRLNAASVLETEQSKSSTEAVFGDWVLQLGRRTLVSGSGDSISLTEGEFKLLSTLMKNAGNVLNRDQIMNRMERRDWFPTDRTIDVLIARLRKKLGDDRLNPRYIDTARGAGYLFLADITWR
ncbi:MAG: DNA-binding response regulator [Gammaproteobacteria bacterium]|nr:MAG: DNA-binding response regulator [Gammaproteobacteria bacterium]